MKKLAENQMKQDGLMDFAVRTAERAGEIVMTHFGSVVVERKGDGSEITAADRASEEFLRQTITEAFPDDAILGEEGTSVAGRSGRRWIVDPIDATRSFASGVPLFGVLIALEVEGAPVLGCCHLPALRETVVAASGAGAWHNGKRASVSTVESLQEARVLTSGLEYWRDWATDEGRDGWTQLVGRSRFGRTWGDCYGYLLVATGRAELMVDGILSAWDAAPFLPIIEEAGGVLTDWAGHRTAFGGSAIATNSALAARAREVLGAGALSATATPTIVPTTASMERPND